MSFSDPETLKRRLGRAGNFSTATVELGRVESKQGIIVRIDLLTSASGLEGVLAHCMEVAAGYRPQIQRIGDPGWWAGVLCTSAAQCGFPAMVLRGAVRSKLHACMIVSSAGMLDEHPEYPLVRIGSRAKTLDLRGEVSSAAPADADLVRYATLNGLATPLPTLRAMFDMGVIEWASEREPVTGRLVLEAVGNHGG